MNFRPYFREMIQELKQDFELILFGLNYQFVDKIVEVLEKDEKLFDHVIKKDMLTYNKSIDYFILDMNILTG